jgi:hypothetical protein
LEVGAGKVDVTRPHSSINLTTIINIFLRTAAVLAAVVVVHSAAVAAGKTRLLLPCERLRVSLLV